MLEDDLPYQVRITASGNLETIGRYDFNGHLSSAIIAHPKLDPVSKEAQGGIFSWSAFFQGVAVLLFAIYQLQYWMK
ncbi:uncharacterized protein A4U43_C04F30030 [Asparagus officinalis]|uniref:Uncharacterized protein n=1 Tax=Asparagus officinalis TaxID=4686 RepID=A0A5P1F5E8_ASPOF|nr:uncharacterized protein A4U43_C04F30030 [Asparagus officinalis]